MFFCYPFLLLLCCCYRISCADPRGTAPTPRVPASWPQASSKIHSASWLYRQRSTGGDVRSLVGCHPKETLHSTLRALVYDILPSTTAVFSCAIRSRKLSANEHFFGGAQTVVSVLQTTQIISDFCFITDHVAYASSNKTKIVRIDVKLFF